MRHEIKLSQLVVSCQNVYAKLNSQAFLVIEYMLGITDTRLEKFPNLRPRHILVCRYMCCSICNSVLHFPLNGIRRHVTHVTSIWIGISTFTSCMIVDACCCHSGTLISRYLNCRGLRESGRLRNKFKNYDRACTTSNTFWPPSASWKLCQMLYMKIEMSKTIYRFYKSVFDRSVSSVKHQ
jgi:hypothetical protein